MEEICIFGRNRRYRKYNIKADKKVDMDWRVILKCIPKDTKCDNVDYIYLTHNSAPPVVRCFENGTVV